MASSEYISREAAESALKQPVTMSMCLTLEECKMKNAQRQIDLFVIRGLPAADVRPEWIMIESRPMDAEERQYYSEQYGYELTDEEAVIYCSQLPEHGQEVLVCNKWGNIWIDTFDDDPDYGVGFETNGDMDGLVAWMPLPETPRGKADD